MIETILSLSFFTENGYFGVSIRPEQELRTIFFFVV